MFSSYSSSSSCSLLLDVFCPSLHCLTLEEVTKNETSDAEKGQGNERIKLTVDSGRETNSFDEAITRYKKS